MYCCEMQQSYELCDIKLNEADNGELTELRNLNEQVNWNPKEENILFKLED